MDRSYLGRPDEFIGLDFNKGGIKVTSEHLLDSTLGVKPVGHGEGTRLYTQLV